MMNSSPRRGVAENNYLKQFATVDTYLSVYETVDTTVTQRSDQDYTGEPLASCSFIDYPNDEELRNILSQ